MFRLNPLIGFWNTPKGADPYTGYAELFQMSLQPNDAPDAILKIDQAFLEPDSFGRWWSTFHQGSSGLSAWYNDEGTLRNNIVLERDTPVQLDEKQTKSGQSHKMYRYGIGNSDGNADVWRIIKGGGSPPHFVAGTYDLFLYGHGDGAADEFTKFSVRTLDASDVEITDYGSKDTGNTAYARDTAAPWIEDEQFVRFSNIVISADTEKIEITTGQGTGAATGVWFNGFQLGRHT